MNKHNSKSMPPYLLGAVALVLAAVSGIQSAFAQPDISSELRVLKGKVLSTTIKSLPAAWTGDRTGLSLVLTLDSPLPVEVDDLSPKHRSAALSICRKMGIQAVEQHRSDPGSELLRFFVVELKAVQVVLSPVRIFQARGIVFDATDNCTEIP